MCSRGDGQLHDGLTGGPGYRRVDCADPSTPTVSVFSLSQQTFHAPCGRNTVHQSISAAVHRCPVGMFSTVEFAARVVGTLAEIAQAAGDVAGDATPSPTTSTRTSSSTLTLMARLSRSRRRSNRLLQNRFGVVKPGTVSTTAGPCTGPWCSADRELDDLVQRWRRPSPEARRVGRRSQT